MILGVFIYNTVGRKVLKYVQQVLTDDISFTFLFNPYSPKTWFCAHMHCSKNKQTNKFSPSPPPFLKHRYGNNQMFASPIISPDTENMNSILLAHFPLGGPPSSGIPLSDLGSPSGASLAFSSVMVSQVCCRKTQKETCGSYQLSSVCRFHISIGSLHIYSFLWSRLKSGHSERGSDKTTTHPKANDFK